MLYRQKLSKPSLEDPRTSPDFDRLVRVGTPKSNGSKGKASNVRAQWPELLFKYFYLIIFTALTM